MTCYERNGTANPETYVKCAGSSMCCRTNDSAADECIDTGRLRGLCKGGPVLWREGCASRDWNSADCLGLCTEGQYHNGDDELVNATQTHIMITECGFDDSVCCGLGDDAIACCEGKRGTKYWIKDFGVYTTRPDVSTGIEANTIAPTSSLTKSIVTGLVSTSSGANALTSTTLSSIGSISKLSETHSRATSLVSSLPSASSSPSPVSPKSPTPTPIGAIAGGVIGGIVGLALLSITMFLLIRRHYKHPTSPPPSNPNIELPSDHRQELPSTGFVLAELPANKKGFTETRYHELDSMAKRH